MNIKEIKSELVKRTKIYQPRNMPNKLILIKHLKQVEKR
jgi:hypothetical protein